MKTLMISAIFYTMTTSISVAQTAHADMGNEISYQQAIKELNEQASGSDYLWDGTNQSDQGTNIRPDGDGYDQTNYPRSQRINDPCPDDAECPEPYAR